MLDKDSIKFNHGGRETNRETEKEVWHVDIERIYIIHWISANKDFLATPDPSSHWSFHQIFSCEIGHLCVGMNLTFNNKSYEFHVYPYSSSLM